MENAEKTKELLLGYLAVIAAAVLTAVNYELFVFPNSFAPVGINGLITMVQYLFHISIGYLSLLINLPLILLTWKTVNAEYAKKTLTYVLVFSLCSLVLHQWPSFQSLACHTENGTSSILGPLAAGLINGVVYGLALRHGGSTGGTDLIAIWIQKKRPEMNLVWMIFPMNVVVAALSFFVYGRQVEPVILCLIYCYFTSYVSDSMLKGGKSARKFEVVTEQANQLSQRIVTELQHSATVLHAEGMYSKTDKDLVICVVNRKQISHFQRILKEFPDAFAYVSSVNETIGNFKRITG
ncbi:MAG: YitT family protein [Oscillibacter sp.]|nr:YitT family protein [Oscillibacter sp.]